MLLRQDHVRALSWRVGEVPIYVRSHRCYIISVDVVVRLTSEYYARGSTRVFSDGWRGVASGAGGTLGSGTPSLATTDDTANWC